MEEKAMGGEVAGEKFSYFQYVREMGYPVFVRIELQEEGAQAPFEWAQEAKTFLEEQRFDEIEEEEFVRVRDQGPDSYRLLTIKRAGPRVVKHLGVFQSSSPYGAEKIIPREGYRFYRFQGHGVMVYSFSFSEWELGICEDLGTRQYRTIHGIILNRFLALALAPLGICGFWGILTKEGLVIMRRFSSLGEAVFIDLQKNCLLSSEGPKRFNAHFSFIRLGSGERVRKQVMGIEELLGFLSSHCVFFDHGGLNVPVRQMLHTLSIHYRGEIYPKSKFNPPREDMAV
ncbi:MAG: hypothetical protein OXB88_02570 [Bacteriovoracales bacterium]|nr:hypothetical protein [Bacteriovoracales bacterium]